MGALGGIVDNAIGAALGTQSGTTLQDFLSKFSSRSGLYANIIDPYASFDVKMKFYPCIVPDKKDDASSWEKMGRSLVKSLKQSLQNAADNATGGLLGSWMNEKSVVSERMLNNENAGKTTFLECLAAANMIVGTEDDFFGLGVGDAVRPLEIQLGPYCQSIVVPHISIESEGTSQSQLGSFPLNGLVVKPDSNILQMDIINTKIALHERIFYPWMREVTLPFWSYATQPYTTATVTIDYSKHNNVKYVFSGCRPVKINTMQASQALDDSNIMRQVTLAFDFMFVQSKIDKISESLKSKLLSTGASLVGSAAKMAKM